MKKRLAGFTLALLLPFSLQAQSRLDDSPETVVMRLNSAMQQEDWQAAAQEFEPQALQEVRELVSTILALTPKSQRARVAMMMFRDVPLQTLETLDDQAFFAAYLQGVMRGSGARVSGSQIIGSVAEGDEQLHVLVRSQNQSAGVEFSKLGVVSLRRAADGWRVQLKGDSRALLEIIKKQSEVAAALPEAAAEEDKP